MTNAEHAKERFLAGNGAGLVRETALARRVQSALERLYQLDRVADVDAFLTRAEGEEREALFVREAPDGDVELMLRVPELGAGPSIDTHCQIIEGVSHFVYLAARARDDRSVTQLELELQAEVDKYVLLAEAMPELDADSSEELRARLFDHVSFEHDEESERGARYRLANEAARRFTRRIERDFVSRCRFEEMRVELRRFWHMGQAEKLRAA